MKYGILVAALLMVVSCGDKAAEAANDVVDVTDVAALPADATVVDAAGDASDVASDVSPVVDVAGDVTLATDVTVAVD